MSRSRHSLVIADDHPLILDGIARLMEIETTFQIVASCRDGEAALQAIRRHAPDIALIDYAMPRLDGLGILSAVRSEGIATRIVLLSASMDDWLVHAAVVNGAFGYVVKESAPETLLECLQQVAAGARWYPPEFVNAAVERESSRVKMGVELATRLTVREAQISLLVVDELSNKEIARRLDLSDGTVKIHLHNIYRKAGLAKRSDLVRLAARFKGELAKRANERGD